MHYRFKTGGVFVEAENFEEAKAKLLADIEAEEEEEKNWHPCDCVGLTHRGNCKLWVVPY